MSECEHKMIEKRPMEPEGVDLLDSCGIGVGFEVSESFEVRLSAHRVSHWLTLHIRPVPVGMDMDIGATEKWHAFLQVLQLTAAVTSIRLDAIMS